MDGVTETVATVPVPVEPPDDTVTVAVPCWPSLSAVIVATPVETPVTRPLEDTVAIVVSELRHVIVRPDSGFPVASRSVATS